MGQKAPGDGVLGRIGHVGSGGSEWPGGHSLHDVDGKCTREGLLVALRGLEVAVPWPRLTERGSHTTGSLVGTESWALNRQRQVKVSQRCVPRPLWQAGSTGPQGSVLTMTGWMMVFLRVNETDSQLGGFLISMIKSCGLTCVPQEDT